MGQPRELEVLEALLRVVKVEGLPPFSSLICSSEKVRVVEHRVKVAFV